MTLAARYRAACAALGLPVWRPGMRTSSKFERVVTVDTDTGDPACAEAGATEDDCACVWMPSGGAEPDFTDPATVGCLLALVREAWEPRRGRDYIASMVHTGTGCGVGAMCGSQCFAAIVLPTFSSEAEALIAALEAAAARREGQP